jgi:hypothetical protein
VLVGEHSSNRKCPHLVVGNGTLFAAPVVTLVIVRAREDVSKDLKREIDGVGHVH